VRLTPESLPALRAALAREGLDGWLLYDFRGVNSIAAALLGLEGFATRRIFAWIPQHGTPVALQHAIEPGPLRHWPAVWDRRIYSTWGELESHVRDLVQGKTLAMEYSPGDAVPVVDRVPAGVVDLVRNAGATVVSSAALITGAFALWTPDDLASHQRAAEELREIALGAFDRIGEALREGRTITEYEVFLHIREEFTRRGLEADHGPIVGASEHAADPHYEPSAEHPRAIVVGDVVLIDLFAHEPGGMWADQTWMAVVGTPSPKQQLVWETIRHAREAAADTLRRAFAAGTPIAGGAADDAARAVIRDAGFGEWFTHRTGHSIDRRGLHGAGPNLDNHETRETRQLVPGCGFSIEPGIYLTGEFGMRTEVNGVYTADGLLITPSEVQMELVVV
jgi:Xaa-Pro aminopeptidase